MHCSISRQVEVSTQVCFLYLHVWFLSSGFNELKTGWVELLQFRSLSYLTVFTLSRLLWVWFSCSASRSGAASSLGPASSSRRANCQSLWVWPFGVMLNTWMRRCEAIWRHTPVQYRVRSTTERICSTTNTNRSLGGWGLMCYTDQSTRTPGWHPPENVALFDQTYKPWYHPLGSECILSLFFLQI